jgi:propanol-preferring alcohol dehydrogenase
MPELLPGQLRVKVEACGLCHTDIHAANGDWPVTPTVPFIPGHEGVGIVTRPGMG